MNALHATELRDLWLPVLVGLVGFAISFAGWGLLEVNQREQLLAASDEMAFEASQAIEADLKNQVDTLRGLQRLWHDFGLRPVDEWRANVGLHVDALPGLNSVTWIDLDQPERRITVGREPAGTSFDIPAERARMQAEGAHLEGPERDDAGDFQYHIFIPVQTPKAHAGALVAEFLVTPFLDAVLQARVEGYALSADWDGDNVYSLRAPSPDPWQRWWQVEKGVSLPLGGEWRITLRPTSELVAARLSPLPHYLLAASLLLSLVLAVVVHQLRVILRQSRFLEASNNALERRGRELENQVAERTEELEDAIAELESFNYSVSHDLRSPLGAILNFTAILQEDYQGKKLGPEGIAILARVHRSAMRATDLLEDLLQLSRAGLVSLTLECIDMEALAREIFAQVKAASTAADVEFVVDPLPKVVADRTLIGDVLANLFSNALKYSRGCEKRQIRVEGRLEENDCIYTVVDNGLGFDMRFVDKIFGLFERLHAEDEVEGTGVGLAMVARIVKRHGGRVWAEAQRGKGARFSFALPQKEAS